MNYQEKEWKILRVLTTNICNYECVYCHNEGQKYKGQSDTITLDQFIRYYTIASRRGIEEVRFSGGEPFFNSDTIKMIEWLDEHSNIEIGLATNGSKVTEEIANRLSKTRTMVTLHFPGVGIDDYCRVTKRQWSLFENCVELFDKYNVDYSFNYTLYPDTITAVDAVIEYSIKRGKRVKLLPYLERGLKKMSSEYVKELIGKLNLEAKEVTHYDDEGFSLWFFESGAAVKIIDSPCYGKNIELCKTYGEIRLLPDLSLMNCIFGNSISTKDMPDDKIDELFSKLWQNMNSCSNVADMQKE